MPLMYENLQSNFANIYRYCSFKDMLVEISSRLYKSCGPLNPFNVISYDAIDATYTNGFVLTSTTLKKNSVWLL